MTSFTRVTDDVDDVLAEQHNELIDGLQAIPGPHDWAMNYKIVPTVSADDLVLTIQTYDGGDASATDPITVNFNGTLRQCEAALSVTKADATNWAGLGGAGFATLEQDLFVYLVWNTNLTPDAVDVFWSRIPYGRVYSDFSSTTTAETYAAINATAPAATDVCVNIGRFAATLSAGAGYTWTVPTFTTANLIQRPIYETRVLEWAPQWTNLTVGSGTYTARKYKLSGRAKWFNLYFALAADSSISGGVDFALPMAADYQNYLILVMADTGIAGYQGAVIVVAGSTTCYLRALGAGGTYGTQAPISATVPFTWGDTDAIIVGGWYE